MKVEGVEVEGEEMEGVEVEGVKVEGVEVEVPSSSTMTIARTPLPLLRCSAVASSPLHPETVTFFYTTKKGLRERVA